jgi:hypothetical protein
MTSLFEVQDPASPTNFAEPSACVYRKSNPDIFVMQSAEDRAAKNTPFPLYGAREHEHVVEAAQTRLDQNPQAMRVRRETVEHPFATLKRCGWVRRIF